MIARLRTYRDHEEAREEWERLSVPLFIGDYPGIRHLPFIFVEGADEDTLFSLREEVGLLGVKALRCDGAITRMVVPSPPEVLEWILESSHPRIRSSLRDQLDPPAPLPLDLNRPAVMGILNVTPDSFSDGGLYLDREAALRRAREMVDQGASIIDVGGESTRPYSDPVEEDVELDRVIPVIEELSSLEVPVSVDTRKPGVAREAVRAGADMVNDVSGLRDPEMIRAIADTGVPVVVMHMLGEPGDMQDRIHYEDVVGDIMIYLRDRMDSALRAGVAETDLLIDPGIGFGKRVNDNLDLIRRLGEFRALGRPVMVGPSRKSFIGRVLGVGSDDRLEGTLAAVTASVMNGADVVRAHDVPESARAVRMADSIVRGFRES
ncbi:MAG: dihydropteroate synthase [Methanomassiliicoccales archaeon]